MKPGLIIIICSYFLVLSGCASLKFSSASLAYHPDPPSFSQVDIALVLGGGGARGAAHVGVLEELLSAGITPQLIVGCSSGAMVGALYADSLDINYVKQTVLDTRLGDMFDVSFKAMSYSLSSGKKLKRYMGQKLRSRLFTELHMPFVAVATNLQFGDATAFGTGPILPALRASAAYPGVFFPVKMHKQYFVDGGVSDPVPVSVAKRFNPKIIIAVDIGEILTKNKPNHVFGLIKRSLEISHIHLSNKASQQADILIKFAFRDIGTFNDELNDQIYYEGRRVTQQRIEDIKALIKAKIPRYKFELPIQE